MKRTKSLLVLCVGIGVLVLTACGTVATGPVATDPPGIVTARAEARWKALIDSNVGQAYDYLSPTTRKLMSRRDYQARIKPGLWRDAKVISVACEPDLCKAQVLLKYDIRDIRGLEMNLEENWIKEEGGWWYVQKK